MDQNTLFRHAGIWQFHELQQSLDSDFSKSLIPLEENIGVKKGKETALAFCSKRPKLLKWTFSTPHLYLYAWQCCVQVSYAIGIAEPLSITVFSYGTSKKSEKELLEIVKNNFDLRPGRIVKWVVQFICWCVSFSSNLNTHLLHITERNVSGIMALSMYNSFGGGGGVPH